MSDEVIKFIHLVQNNECLYKNNMQEYSNRNITEKAWAGIAQQMNWTVAVCKEKWRNIRNGFVRSIKTSPCGSSASKKRYYLHDVMEFVLPYVKPVQHLEQTSNIDIDENRSEVVEENENNQETINCTDATSFSSRKKKKTKKSKESDMLEKNFVGYTQEKQGKETQYNARKMFLLSLLPDVYSLSDSQFRQFKIRTMLMVEEMLNKKGREGADQDLFRPLPSNSSSSHSTPALSPIDPLTPTSLIYMTPSKLEANSSQDDSNPNTWGAILNP